MGGGGGETGPETSYGAEDTPPRVLAETRTQQPSLLRQLQFSLRSWRLAGCGLKDPEGKREATGALRRLSPTGKGAEVLTGTRTDGKEVPLPPRQTPAARSHHTRNTVNSFKTMKRRQDGFPSSVRARFQAGPCRSRPSVQVSTRTPLQDHGPS